MAKKAMQLVLLASLLAGMGLGLSGCVTKFTPVAASDGYAVGMDIPYMFGIAPAGAGTPAKKKISELPDSRD